MVSYISEELPIFTLKIECSNWKKQNLYLWAAFLIVLQIKVLDFYLSIKVIPSDSCGRYQWERYFPMLWKLNSLMGIFRCSASAQLKI